MELAPRNRLSLFGLVFGLIMFAIGLGVTGLGPARAAPCGHIHVAVAHHVVAPGQVVRVSGSTCDAANKRPRVVRIRLHTAGGWRQVGIARTNRSGRYSRRVRVGVSQRARAARLQVQASRARTSTKLTVADAGSSSCPLDEPESEIGMTLSGCKVIASDTAEEANPLTFWGSADCGAWPDRLEPNRPERPVSGGDTHLTATGVSQGNDAFRRITTFDGDNIDGERCELGKNDSQAGPTAFYHEGQRRVTYISIRLPDNFPLAVNTWQTIMQMKQAQPANNGGGVPILFMEAFNNRFYIDSEHGVYWTFPAVKDTWVRFMWDVTYSQNPNIGSVQVAADLNGDGDFNDPGERMPRIHTSTLKVETPGPDTVNPVGSSIPDHLRAGIYHNSTISCPRPVGCSTEIDNVQVVAP